MLERPDGLSHFVRRARADRFEHDPDTPRAQRATLVDVAERVLRTAGSETESLWRGRLERVDNGEVERIVEAVPGLSVVARTFILELLNANRGRVLDVR